MTPLHLAAECGNIEVIKLLLEFGANPKIRTYDDVRIELSDKLPSEIKPGYNAAEISEVFKKYVMPLKIKLLYDLIAKNDSAEIKKLPVEMQELSVNQLKYKIPKKIAQINSKAVYDLFRNW
eukprot:Phypoly_transcript_22469.p1 GENE.Phypoly_transcript_22469~~Phypoly_transcript_22469.p1  ORF type:complete len:122 (+),score=19.02 Phypoly_transcript_22469:185-550(+)